jgi:Domain of Unknown Function with PDB structure (DUF3857)/Transglutaminase-like superfamily
MNKKRFLKPTRSVTRIRLAAWFLLAAGAGLFAPAARGGVPDWLREASQIQLPKYDENARAVTLLDDQTTTVSSSGEIKTRHRLAFKILTTEGREMGIVKVYFDNDTRLTYLKAWSISSSGQEYEVKEGEAVEASFPGGGELYNDTRYKVFRIPASEPGNVIGYEYEQRQRPNVLQDMWLFQDDIPVKRARFELELPQGWEFDTFWLNHAAEKPQAGANNQWVWELNDLPAVEDEPAMPDWRAVAGRMGVTYFPRRSHASGHTQAAWAEIARWYAHLAQGRNEASPEIQQKVAELAPAQKTSLDKIQALAKFVQRDIRYVAIEIGVGGYQPHPAGDVLRDRYGDCKDKATLLSAMLHGIGVDSYYVLINSQRGVVEPSLPSSLVFNHVILAIRLPKEAETPGLFAVRDDPRRGKLLFFDPTDPMTTFGYLPASLQANHGLLVAEDGGDLIELPLLLPALNRVFRAANFQIDSQGSLSGAVREILWGAPNAATRARYEAVPESEQRKMVEAFVAGYVGGLVFKGLKLENIDDYDQNVLMTYSFLAKDYGKRAGNLLLIRPRVLGEKILDLNQEKGKERKYPVEFNWAGLETDMFEIALPAGYEVDELPAPVDIKSPFGEYRSKVEVAGNNLKYQRNYQINTVLVAAERVEELKKFYRQIDDDERSSVVLRQVTTPQPPAPAPH